MKYKNINTYISKYIYILYVYTHIYIYIHTVQIYNINKNVYFVSE